MSHHELTLYFVSSPYGIDWTSPSTLALSAAKNKFRFKSHFMGHVWVEIKSPENQTHELTGMVGDRPDYLNQVVVQKRGLGVLYHRFPGRLENKEDIVKEWKGLGDEGRLNFLRFRLRGDQAQRILSYLREYRELGVGCYYGLSLRPRHQEGAGCSAFGVSFLDVLGLVDEEITREWSHCVKIPKKLSGPPLEKTGVPLSVVLFQAKEWSLETEEHHKLFFWDPDKMFHWVRRRLMGKGLEKRESHNNPFGVIDDAYTQGLVVDKSHVPLPEESIWKKV